MNRIRLASLALLIIWLVQAACNMPVEQLPDTGAPDLPSTPPGEQAQQTRAAAEITPTATRAAPTATPAPQNTPPVSFELGVISGILWRDVCIQGGGSGPAPDAPSTGCISVSPDVYQANGFREFNEPGITNVSVSLGAGACPALGPAPAVLASAVTDADGTYTFAGLVSGRYCVFIDPAASKNAEILASGGWTFPDSDSAAQTVTLTSGERKTDVNFGWDGRLQVAAVEDASGSDPTPAAVAQNPPENPTAPMPSAPAPTSIPQSPAPTAAASPTAASETAVPTPPGPGNGSQADAACSDQASFVSDVTIPDDTVVTAGSAFVKTWRIRNDGTCTWKPGSYVLEFSGGDNLAGPDQVDLTEEVQPGQTVDLSVDLVAPATPGTYVNLWMFRVAQASPGSGAYLGVGPDGAGPLYTRIVVDAAGAGLAGPPAQAGATQIAPAALQVPITGVSFEPGTTSSTVEGNLAPGEGEGYALRASQGYALIASLQSQAGDVYLDISAEDGAPLQVVSRPDGSYLVSELPSNQRYIVKVIAGSQESAYALTLEIPALISLDQNSGSASGGGTIAGGRSVAYMLRGQAGQNLSVSVSSPGSAVSLSISGLHDGLPLAGTDASGGLTTWTGELPQTQAYLIQAVPSVESTSFTIQVSVTP